MRLTITSNLIRDRHVRIGDATFVPERFTARFEFPEDHTVEMDIEIHDERPEVAAIHVYRGEGQPPLSGDELRRMPVANWTEAALAQAAYLIEEQGPGQRIIRAPAERDEPQVLADVTGAAKRRRRLITSERLAEVAHAYEQAGGNAAEVGRSLNVSRSQAFRLVKQARDAGLIEKED